MSIPKRFPRAQLAQLIEHNRDWIERSLADLEASIPECYRQWPPSILPLDAIGVQMVLNYEDELHLPAQSNVSGVTLGCSIAAPVSDRLAVAHEISLHLKKIARKTLPGLLASHAHLHGFSYKRVSIRGQRTVWGSYSSSGTVSLNYKLLFLQRELVDYVLLHELVHTVHQNHSKAFWTLLGTLNVNARTLDRRLRDAAKRVPPWLELTYR